jgi:hypothetical protein
MPKETKKNMPALVHSRLLNLAHNAQRPLNKHCSFTLSNAFSTD